MPRPTHFDPLGETEEHTTIYTFRVYVPHRPLPRLLRTILAHRNAPSADTAPAGEPSTAGTDPRYECFKLEHLEGLPTKTVRITASWFPPDMRCEHLNQNEARVCTQGCYFLERGGDGVFQWRCEREDCEGHVYCGETKKDEEGVVCFGMKGRRLVCLERQHAIEDVS